MTAVLLAAEILVGVTGYGTSPEMDDIRTNDACNLFVQWEKSGNLLPGGSNDAWIAWAKANGIRVMTIYGDQDGAQTKALRECWGDLYLGNNIGEYAGFLYQGEKSHFSGWPKCKDLREAHDWLVGEMLAKPKAAQMRRPPEEREPCVYSTSGSPLACYELQGGIDVICNEMYAVGCGNLAYATAEARGAAKRFGRELWAAWLAHEWQTCWLRVPYSVPQKMDSLEIGLKAMWVMGTSLMVLESGSQTTQAEDYTPPDGMMREFKTAKQFYDDPVPKAYRKTMRDFYRWTKAHPRAEGRPEVKAALLLGNYDGYVGMTHGVFAIFGQHHLAAADPNWKCAAPERTWEAVMEAFFPRPADALKPYANGWLGGTPYGQLDVVNVDDALTVGQLRPYRVIAFGGWNTMTPKIASTLQAYAREGGEVILCAPQLSGRVDRDFRRFANAELVQAVPGVKVGAPKPVEDILMVRSCAPAFLKAAYPAHLGATMAVCAAELGPDVETLATMGRVPYLVKAKVGKGAMWLSLAWHYPADRVDGEDYPSYRNVRLEFWKTLLTGLVNDASDHRLSGPGRGYVNWAVYGQTAYLLNTDCISPRTVTFRGQELALHPKELRAITVFVDEPKETDQ